MRNLFTEGDHLMNRLITLLAIMFLAGCVQTSELRLAENVFQLQASGQGLLAQGKTSGAVFKRGAQLTIDNGYSHFVLGVPSTRSSSSVVGFTPVYANIVGNSVFVNGGQPMVARRETTTVLVRMSNSSTGGALDAGEVLRSLK